MKAMIKALLMSLLWAALFIFTFYIFLIILGCGGWGFANFGSKEACPFLGLKGIRILFGLLTSLPRSPCPEISQDLGRG